MGPKQQRNSSKAKETTPTYEAAKTCVRDDTQTLDQTSEFPRDNIDAENALREIQKAIEARTGRPVFLPENPPAETSASSESSASATSSASSTASSTAPLTTTSIVNDDESIAVRQYRDSFALQTAPNVPTEQTATVDQYVDAVDDNTDIIQMGNVVNNDPPIRKRAAEAPRPQTLFNMLKEVQLKKGNINFATARAFKTQAEDPNCNLIWRQVIMEDGRREIAMMLVNPLHHNLCSADKKENWPADSDLTLLQIADLQNLQSSDRRQQRHRPNGARTSVQLRHQQPNH